MILDERAELEDFRKSKKIKTPYKYISLLCKHYYSDGLSKKEAKELVVEEIKKALKTEYSVEQHEDDIVKMLDNTYKKKIELKIVDSVRISKKEMDVIKNREDYRDGKMLFSMLVYTKLELAKGNKGWINNLDTMFQGVDIKSRTQEEKMSYIKPSYEEKLVKFYFDFKKASTDPSVRVVGKTLFHDEVVSDNDLLFELKDLNNFWFYYDYYVVGDKNLKRCENCGVIIKKKSKFANIQYCDNCKKEITKDNWIKASKKYYEKQNDLS